MNGIPSGRIKVVVSGAAGRMGREVVEAVSGTSDLDVVAEVDAGDNLRDILSNTPADCLVDFSVPTAVLSNIRTALEFSIVPIVGTTGLVSSDLAIVQDLCRRSNCGGLIAPNFAIGAVLLMKFAQEAARYLPDVEIIEMHHERKIDSPSGTAIKTAEMIAEGRQHASPSPLPAHTIENLEGARGATTDGNIRIHSVRLPGFVASEMVIFGGVGQTLTLRHDSIDRKSFMPGVLFAVRKTMELRLNGGKLVYGLDILL